MTSTARSSTRRARPGRQPSTGPGSLQPQRRPLFVILHRLFVFPITYRPRRRETSTRAHSGRPSRQDWPGSSAAHRARARPRRRSAPARRQPRRQTSTAGQRIEDRAQRIERTPGSSTRLTRPTRSTGLADLDAGAPDLHRAGDVDSRGARACLPSLDCCLFPRSQTDLDRSTGEARPGTGARIYTLRRIRVERPSILVFMRCSRKPVSIGVLNCSR